MKERAPSYTLAALVVAALGAFLCAGLAGEAPAPEARPRKHRAPRYYTRRVNLHHVEPEVMVPRDDKLTDLDAKAAEADVESGGGEGGLPLGSVLSPAAPVSHSRKKSNWIVPADIAGSEEEAPAPSGWGWLADEVQTGEGPAASRPGKEEDTATEEEAELAYSLRRKSAADSAKAAADSDSVFKMTIDDKQEGGAGIQSPAATENAAAPRKWEETREARTAYERYQQEEAAPSVWAARDATGFFGRDAGEEAMPQTQALLSQVTESIAESLRPAIGTPADTRSATRASSFRAAGERESRGASLAAGSDLGNASDSLPAGGFGASFGSTRGGAGSFPGLSAGEPGALASPFSSGSVGSLGGGVDTAPKTPSGGRGASRSKSGFGGFSPSDPTGSFSPLAE